MAVELSEQFFAKAAGWEAMKNARAYLQNDQVLSSDWSPPVLKGVVQAGGTSYRAGLVIKTTSNIENICTCKQSRDWGTICAHSVAVGLHYLKPPKASVPKAAASSQRPGAVRERPQNSDILQRSPMGEPLDLFLIFPPNLQQAIERGKVMVCLEGKWSRGRSPLNALPRDQVFQLSAQDDRVLQRIEELAGGITPPMLMLQTDQLAELLPMLIDHPRMTLGRSTELVVTKEPLTVPVRAELQETGELLAPL